jgi:hypothetical protein
MNTIKKNAITVILTGYKRDHFDEQIPAILNQSIKPDAIYLWQNEHHVDLSQYRKKYGISIIQADKNFKFHGRFALGLLFSTEYICIFDDDIIPGKLWLENCMRASKEYNAIIGGNGRTFISPGQWSGYETKVEQDSPVDLCGHCWFFKREWLSYLWMDLREYRPNNTDTGDYEILPLPPSMENGEDIQFCLSSKIFGNIDTYVPKQMIPDEMADTKQNKYSVDQYSSFLLHDHKSLRDSIIEYYKICGWISEC